LTAFETENEKEAREAKKKSAEFRQKSSERVEHNFIIISLGSRAATPPVILCYVKHDGRENQQTVFVTRGGT